MHRHAFSSRSARHVLTILVAAMVLTAACSSGSDSSSTENTDNGTEANDSGSDLPSVPDAYTAVVVRVLGEPTFPFLGTDGRYHVAYDLELQNTAAAVPATIEKVQVVDAENTDTVVATFEGNEFVDPDCDYGDCNRLRNLTGQPEEDVVIPPQEGRILFVDFAAENRDDLPDFVSHQVVGEAAISPASQDPEAVDYLAAPYDISAGEPTVLAPPLAGENWVALNGCCEPGWPHRSSPGPFNGKIINGQRFAIDWKQTNEAGEFFEGDPNDNESYVDYGADLLAVADGIVITTLDGMKANKPGVLPANDPELRDSITVENVDGNHIVLDLGNGTYAFYAHLLAGSLLVEEGDTVKEGDKIAELGNTGNANASHLHFHLMDGPSVLGSNGLPYLIDSFEFNGQVDPQQLNDTDDFLSGDWGAGRLTQPEDRTDELPLLLNIVNFPSDGS